MRLQMKQINFRPLIAKVTKHDVKLHFSFGQLTYMTKFEGMVKEKRM